MKKIIPILALVLLVPTAHADTFTVPAQVIMHFDAGAIRLNSVDGVNFNVLGAPFSETGNGRSVVNFGKNNWNSFIENDDSYGIDGGDVSMGAWVKINAQLTKPNQSYTFIMQSSNISKVRYSLSYEKTSGYDMVCFHRKAVGVSQIDSCGVATLKPGIWYHLAGVRDDKENYTYLNGEQISHNTSDSVNGTVDVWNEVSFGALHYTSATSTFYANFASAKMDEAFVTASAISQNTVLAVYNGGKPLVLNQ